jgi:hypothetical protein
MTGTAARGVVTSLWHTPSGTRRCRCGVGRELRAHHDRLLRVERDRDELSALLELALGWAAAPSGADAVSGTIRPDAWVAFARAHVWVDPDRVHRLFDLMTELATRPQARPTSGLGVRPLAAAAVRHISDAALMSGEL